MCSMQAGCSIENTQYAVDRIEEGKIAVCQDLITGQVKDVLLSNLPSGVHEGSVLDYKDGKYELNEKEEKIRRDRIKQKMNLLFNKN